MLNKASSKGDFQYPLFMGAKRTSPPCLRNSNESHSQYTERRVTEFNVQEKKHKEIKASCFFFFLVGFFGRLVVGSLGGSVCFFLLCSSCSFHPLYNTLT